MAINKLFCGATIYKPGNWGGGPRVWSLNDEERSVHGLFKTLERFGIVKRVVMIKYDVNILFCVDEESVNESHEEFMARFKK